MIDANAAIISYKSVGSVIIGDAIDIYINELYKYHRVIASDYYLPDGERRLAYFVDNMLTIATLSCGKIISIGCNESYKGKYQNKLYAGITMGELIKLTDSQRILNGTLIVNEDYGLSFTLPPPYDEIADYIEHIPLDLKLNEIYVSDYSFWSPKKSKHVF